MNVQDLLTVAATSIEIAALTLVAVGVLATALNPSTAATATPSAMAQSNPSIAPHTPCLIVPPTTPVEVAPIVPSVQQKETVPVPSLVVPVGTAIAQPELTTPACHPFTVRELRTIAPKLDIKGAARLNRSTLNRISQSRLTALALV